MLSRGVVRRNNEVARIDGCIDFGKEVESASARIRDMEVGGRCLGWKDHGEGQYFEKG